MWIRYAAFASSSQRPIAQAHPSKPRQSDRLEYGRSTEPASGNCAAVERLMRIAAVTQDGTVRDVPPRQVEPNEFFVWFS